MYVDYEEYQELWHGRLSYEEFTAAEPKAEAHIRYLTCYAPMPGSIFDKPDQNVKLAVCAATDLVSAADAEAAGRSAGVSGVKSESNDGYSVTYITDAVEGQTAEQALVKRILAAVRIYLLPTGWLYRGVRMR